MATPRIDNTRNESSFQRTVLDNDDFKSTLNTLKQLVESCYGPRGRMKIIHNNVGGPLTITSASSRLLMSLSELNPFVRFILTSVQGHLKHYSDGGLFASLLCINLIEAAVNLSSGRQFIIEWYQKFLDCIKQGIESDPTLLTLKGNMVNLNFLKVIVRSILATKPLCSLTREKLDFLTCLVLETFFSVIKKDTDINFEDNIHFIATDGVDVKESKFYNGLLIDTVDSSVLKLVSRKWNPPGVPFPTDKFSCLKIVLITISLSGDLEAMADCHFEVDTSVGAPEMIVVKRITEFCDEVIKLGVELILCQKVVHPRVKQFIRSHNVVVIDRLGKSLMNLLKRLIGCTTIGSFLSAPTTGDVGLVDAVSVVYHYDKKYVHLQKNDSGVGSLILGHIQEEEVSELKTVVKAALRSLEVLVQDSNVVFGAGCWEICLCHYLKSKILIENSDLLQNDSRLLVHVLDVLQAFLSALYSVVRSLGRSDFDFYIDSLHHHLWKIPKGDNPNQSTSVSCNCGIIKMSNSSVFEPLEEINFTSERLGFGKMPDFIGVDYAGGMVLDTVDPLTTVLDCCKIKLSSLTTAVTTACAVLSINQVITDIN